MGVDEITQIERGQRKAEQIFVYSINLLSTYHVPGTVPGARNITVNMELTFYW